METIAFVGPSGTGKSHRSMIVADENHADYVIDDGLLIQVQGSRVIAGTSAKKEATRVASVKHAVFLKDSLAKEMRIEIRRVKPQKLMLLGTSDEMVAKIAARLGIPAVSHTIYIQDVSTPEEMEIAHKMRTQEGKHVIPVPTFEIKQDFSGYFLHPLRIFQKKMDQTTDSIELTKSIIRPTFSYMGNYQISDLVLTQIAKYETERLPEVFRFNNMIVRKTEHGVHLDIAVTLYYGVIIPDVCANIRQIVGNNIEKYTSVNARRIHIYVKGLRRL